MMQVRQILLDQLVSLLSLSIDRSQSTARKVTCHRGTLHHLRFRRVTHSAFLLSVRLLVSKYENTMKAVGTLQIPQLSKIISHLDRLILPPYHITLAGCRLTYFNDSLTSSKTRIPYNVFLQRIANDVSKIVKKIVKYSLARVGTARI